MLDALFEAKSIVSRKNLPENVPIRTQLPCAHLVRKRLRSSQDPRSRSPPALACRSEAQQLFWVAWAAAEPVLVWGPQVSTCGSWEILSWFLAHGGRPHVTAQGRCTGTLCDRDMHSVSHERFDRHLAAGFRAAVRAQA